MARKKLTLQDVARRAADLNGGKGGRALQRIATQKGLTLSYATVDRILAGKYESTPQRQTIEALAVLANMPLAKVYEAAGLPLPMAPLAEQLPDGSDYLTTQQRRVVLDVIRGFIRDNDRMVDLELELEARPLPPYEYRRMDAEGIDPSALSDDGLEELYTQLVQGTPHRETVDAVLRLRALVEDAMRQRGLGDIVEDSPQPDGVTTGERGAAAAPDRPWEKDEFALAAKRGRNIGAEIRRRQDAEAEASQDNEE